MSLNNLENGLFLYNNSMLIYHKAGCGGIEQQTGANGLRRLIVTESGFTLIELMVVILIIGTLVGIAVARLLQRGEGRPENGMPEQSQDHRKRDGAVSRE